LKFKKYGFGLQNGKKRRVQPSRAMNKNPKNEEEQEEEEEKEWLL
jgi:hypothetical protein